MRTLFWKLFGAFWLTTFAILAVSIFISFYIADGQTSYPFADPREVDQQLQAILQRDGVSGLEAYVADKSNFPPGQTVYLIDEDGGDLLNRKLPDRVHRRAGRLWTTINSPRDRRGAQWRSMRLRESLLKTADDRTFLAMPGPAPKVRFGFIRDGKGRWVVLGIAAAFSLLGFWWLSRSLARPVVRISQTANRLAAGEMDARVGASAYTHDEIGQLAEQFDRMAEELALQSRTRLEMFRNIAHELRAPLTRLQIATELLQRKPDTGEQQIERMHYEIERVESLASQVLALARVEGSSNSATAFSLGPIIDKVIEDARFEASSREVKIHYSASNKIIQLKGDAIALASAIENVVRNAIQISPSGSEVSVIVSHGAQTTIAVLDKGPGVSPEMLGKIFEPFYRIDTNRAGAGIGLAITKRAVQQMGGNVTAVNNPEGGLQVTLSFPA